MEDLAENIDLPDVDHSIDVPGNAPDIDMDDSECERGHTVEEGHGHYFTHFVKEFSENLAADIIGHEETSFECMKHHHDASGGGAYALFVDREEWELAQWLIKNANQCATEEFLKLPIVSFEQLW